MFAYVGGYATPVAVGRGDGIDVDRVDQASGSLIPTGMRVAAGSPSVAGF